MANKLSAADPKLDRYIVAAADAFPIATKEVKDALLLIRATLERQQHGTTSGRWMRAVDFVVVRIGGHIVADTKSPSIQAIWKIGGWEAKLVAAASGTKMIGPLKHPYEPWHWRLART
jgi:hypothetical protein